MDEDKSYEQIIKYRNNTLKLNDNKNSNNVDLFIKNNNVNNKDNNDNNINNIINSKNTSDPKITTNLQSYIRLKKLSLNGHIKAIKKPSFTWAVSFVVFIQLNIVFGTGVFSFGNSAKEFSLFFLLIFNIIFSFVDYWSVDRMIYTGNKMHCYDYGKIVCKLLGKVPMISLEICVICFDYGILMQYIYTFYSLIGRFVHNTFYTDRYETYDAYNSKVWNTLKYRLPVILVISLLLGSLTFSRNITKYMIISCLSFSLTLFGIFVVIVQTPASFQDYLDNEYEYSFDKNGERIYPNWTDYSQAFTKELKFLNVFSTVNFSYSAQHHLFSIYQAIKEKGFTFQETAKKLYSGTFIATVVFAVIQTAMIICTFFNNPTQPEESIIFKKGHVDHHNNLLNAAKLAVALSLCLTTPVMFEPAKICILNVFNKGVTTGMFNYILTYITFIAAGIVTIFYDNLVGYFNYLGGFFGVFLNFFFPILIYVKCNGKGFCDCMNAFELCWAFFLTLIGVVAGIVSLIKEF